MALFKKHTRDLQEVIPMLTLHLGRFYKKDFLGLPFTRIAGQRLTDVANAKVPSLPGISV
jgi:hypothetical protein